jgi:hypothetical protein
LSFALLTSSEFGKPELPVRNTLPLRRTTNARVGTSTHQTLPVYGTGSRLPQWRRRTVRLVQLVGVIAGEQL